VVGLFAGILVRRSGRVPVGSHEVLNVWVLDVALPALAFRAMHGLVFPGSVALVVAAPYLLFAISVAIFLAARRMLRLSREATGTLIATAAMANTSFVGIPMVTAFFGEDDVPVALLVDQLGSFVLLMTVVSVTVTLAARPAGGPDIASESIPEGPSASQRADPPAAAVFHVGRTIRVILTAPAMLALLTGLALRPVDVPSQLDEALASLGATLTPVALFAVGLQLHIEALRAWRRELTLGLVVKLVLAPAAVVGVYLAAGEFDAPAVDVALFEMAMPPMVAGSIMATRAGLATPLPSLLVGVGVPASFLTLPVWSWLLQR
jgi:predicted permease